MIVHFCESLGGIQAVHSFRREPRNQEIFEHLDDRYRRANVWSQRLAAAYGPGVQLVGRMTTAIVVFYGGWLAIDGQVSVGVLAAFLLYLRRFFEPMQELSQFYNLFQASAAGLEKLSGVLEEPSTVPPPACPTPLDHASGALRFERRRVRVSRSPGAARLRSGDPRWPDDRDRRRDRRGQDDGRPARGAVLGPDGGPGDARRCRLARPRARRPSPRDRDCHAGELLVHRVGRREHRARAAPARHARRSKRRRARSAPTSSSRRSPTATTPTSTRRARGSRPGSVSSCRSPGRSSPTRPS